MKYWNHKEKRLITAEEKARLEAAKKEAVKKAEVVPEPEEDAMMDFGASDAAATKAAKRTKK